MKALLFALFAAAGAAHAQIDQLTWLAGCWASERAEAGSGEQWMAPAGDAMFGVGRTLRNGHTVEHEFMQIRVGADGVLLFVAQPSGQHEATFGLVQQGHREVAFENLQHDFPTRLSYRLQADDRLVARIEGRRAGKPRGIDYAFKRVACPGAR